MRCRKREQFVNCNMHVTFVSSVDQLPDLRAELAEASCVALDVEWRPGGLRGAPGATDGPKAEGPAALLQVSVWNQELCPPATETPPGPGPGGAAAGTSSVGQGFAAAVEAKTVEVVALREAVAAAMREPVKTFVIDLLRLGVCLPLLRCVVVMHVSCPGAHTLVIVQLHGQVCPWCTICRCWGGFHQSLNMHA